MRERALAFIALRVLAVYFAISGARELVNGVYVMWPFDDFSRESFVTIVNAAVPLLGALILWIYTSAIAVRASEPVVLTKDELDRYLDEQAEDDMEGTPAVEPAGTADTVEPKASWLPIALAVLGAFFVVRGATFIVQGLLYFALANLTSLRCNSGSLFQQGPCEFWHPERIQALINLFANILTFVLGLWLLLRPEIVLDIKARIAERRAHRYDLPDDA